MLWQVPVRVTRVARSVLLPELELKVVALAPMPRLRLAPAPVAARSRLLRAHRPRKMVVCCSCSVAAVAVRQVVPCVWSLPQGALVQLAMQLSLQGQL